VDKLEKPLVDNFERQLAGRLEEQLVRRLEWPVGNFEGGLYPASKGLELMLL
jgi:hypothetical protein